MEATQYEPGLEDEAQADQHVLELMFTNIIPRFNFFLSPSFDVGLRLPVRIADVQADFLGFQGEPLEGFESIHHRTETLVGLADTPLDVGWTLREPLPMGHQMTVRVGATLPTGNIEPDPFALGAQGLDHQHIFFGTGTVNPIWSLAYNYGIGKHQLFFFGRGQHTFFTNEYDYQGPSLMTLGATFNYTILKSWQLLGSFNTFKEWPAKWRSQNARNSGRLDLIPGLGVRWMAGNGIFIGASTQRPINIQSDGGQIQMPWMLSIESNFIGAL